MTREQIVVDASVAIALVHGEPDTEAIRRAVDTWFEADVEMVVPDHFWLEVVNPLARRHRYDSRRLLEALRELDEFSIRTIETTRPQLVLALAFIERYGLTAYDAVYLALAETLSARLASTDRVLLGAAGRLGLDPRLDPGTRSGHRLAEEHAPYGRAAERPVTWPTWPGAGAYLATLRRQAMAER